MKQTDNITSTKQVKQSKEQKSLIQGGEFTRARYSMTALGEDVKNCIIDLFQFITKGQKLNGPISAAIVEGLNTIPTEYGEVDVVRVDNPKSKKLQSYYHFTVPYQFFIRGRRTDNKIYREIEEAFKRLVECKFEIIDSDDDTIRYSYTGIISAVDTLSAKKDAKGRNSYISFVMSRNMIELLFDSSRGFYRFLSDECMALTSVYAKRMYVILSGQEKGTIWNITEANFRKMFELEDKYEKFSNLERSVIKPLVQEVNELTSLTISYNVEKGINNKKVFSFHILKNSIGIAPCNIKRQISVMWIDSNLKRFLKETVRMTPEEIQRNNTFFMEISKRQDILAKIPRKWDKITERFADRIDNYEKVRKEKIAYLIGSLQGMLLDD